MADRLKVYEDTAGCWRWHLIAPNGKLIASSGESFDSLWNAARAARRANPDADMEIDGVEDPAGDA